jgi:hypothetical protein
MFSFHRTTLSNPPGAPVVLGGPLVAVVVNPSRPHDREIAKGVAQHAREAGTRRLYIEEEAPRRGRAPSHSSRPARRCRSNSLAAR